MWHLFPMVIIPVGKQHLLRPPCLPNLEVSASIYIWALWPDHEYLKSELYRVIVASYMSHMII